MAVNETTRRETKTQFHNLEKRMDEDGVRRLLEGGLGAIEHLDLDPREWLRAMYQRGRLLYWMLVDWWNGDYRLSWRVVASIAAAVTYLVMPMDAIPDYVPLAGFADDAMLLTWAVNWLGDEVQEYMEWLPEEYRAELDAICDVEEAT